MTPSAPRPGRAAAPLVKTSSKTGTRRKHARAGWASRAQDLPRARSETLRLEPFEPQLAALGDTPPGGDRWIHESKFDGYRLVGSVVDGSTRLWSRNAIDWSGKIPGIAKALARLEVASLAVDGELVYGSGRPEDFNSLQAALANGKHGSLRFVLFDLLHVDGYGISDAPLIERKALLADIIADCPGVLAFSTHIEGHGADVFAHSRRLRLEGIVSKRADAPYRSGRGNGWQKTKNVSSEEFAAVGYTRRKGQREGFSSLLLARHGEEGWEYAGRVGSGFSQEQIRAVSRRIARLGDREPTARVPAGVAPADLRDALWFPPMFVVDAFSRGTGSSGVLRHASLKEIRLDKSPDDLAKPAPPDAARPQPAKAARTVIASPRRAARTVITADVAEPGARVGGSAGKPGSTATASRSSRRSAAHAAVVSNPGKVLFPDDGITKQEVADYYASVMDHLLRHVRGRPLSVIRCPSGTGGKCFFQKHLTAGLRSVRTVRLKEGSGVAAQYLVVEDAAGLMELVQHNALEFHPWGALAGDPERADRVVFDLDPGPGVPWQDVVASARQIRGYLADAGLESFVRTTGGKGLHVVVPLSPPCPWDDVKRFAKGFAVALAAAEPERYVAVMTLAKRPGRIFVDYLRNGRSATAVASYSLRARPGAPVAVPLAWNELDDLASGDAFGMRAVLARLSGKHRDPWAGIDALAQDLSRWSA